MNKFREWRDAALFTYGMGIAQRRRILYATEAGSDYDFVARWPDGDGTSYCPVQLKEVVSQERNARATVRSLLGSLGKYGRTDTVLAVKLNRTGEFNVADLSLPDAPTIPFKQLWFFWAAAPGGARWCLYGGDPGGPPSQSVFDYPA